MSEKLAPSTRHQVQHEGRTVYEWDQTLHEVNIYIQAPPGAPAKALDVRIQPRHLQVGLKGNPPYMALPLHAPVKADSSLWTLADGCITVTLEKVSVGNPWPGVAQGHEAPLQVQQQDQQRLLLERFQAEHGGFDFSQAQVNGSVPNPADFMGGVRHT